MLAPDRNIIHAEIEIGDSRIFIADESASMGVKALPTVGGTTSSLHVYVPEVDAAFARAISVGAKPVMPPADMFWGERYARFTDPYGHAWGLGAGMEDLTPAEIEKRSAEFFAKMAQGPAPPR